MMPSIDTCACSRRFASKRALSAHWLVCTANPARRAPANGFTAEEDATLLSCGLSPAKAGKLLGRTKSACSHRLEILRAELAAKSG